MYNDYSSAEDKSIFTRLLILMMLFSLSVAAVMVYMLVKQDRLFIRMAVITLLVMAVIVILAIIVTLISILLIYSGRGNLSSAGRIVNRFLNIMFFPALGFGKLIGLEKQRIQRAYACINNRIVYSSRRHLQPGDILLLLPHCLQNSQCRHRITVDINNCAGCGKCQVADLVRLGKELGIKIQMVPGGTLARKIIMEVKPRAIVAVACEADLCSGIRDTGLLPVIGILNERPRGPCRDTIVDVDKVEKAIGFLINGRY